MLIDFTVENYASFKEKNVLSAETGARLRKFKDTNTFKSNEFSLLKSLALFGPNGSGKSNMINGLKNMRNMVLHDSKMITDTLLYNPFRGDNDSREKPQVFDVRFTYGEKSYRYKYAFDMNEIKYEMLAEITPDNEEKYFERIGQKYPVLPKRLRNSARSTKANTLFLYTAQHNNDKKSIDIVKWFEELIFVDNVSLPRDFLKLLKDNRVKKALVDFLNFADLNITDFKVRTIAMPTKYRELVIGNSDQNTEFSGKIYELITVHKVYQDGKYIGNEEFQLSEESLGTQKMLMIAFAIMHAKVSGSGRTIIIDEFDDALHFELSKALMSIFNSEQNKNQFILTTHELELLDCNLRVDQIYLFEKDFQGKSILNSIFDFDSRNLGRRDITFARRYMEGRFGAVPQVRLKNMIESLEKLESGEGI